MTDWRESYLERFAKAQSAADVFAELVAAVNELGFEYCSYGIRTPLPVSNPGFSLHSNYPEAWVNRYVSENYFTLDPTVTHALTRSDPLVWQANQLNQGSSFWDEADQYGLRYGWCMPVRDGIGMIGLITMVRSSEKIIETELSEKERQMAGLVNIAHSAMARHVARNLAPEFTAELTAREREALRWSAAGKTYMEIARILSVDDRTVKFHLVNAMRKLNASNKTEAAVKASILGMLY